jgi:DNA-binding response OmpR family regulator
MPKVLIIEDRRENIVFIANNILKPQGYEVITAMDGQTGLAKAQEEKPDLIITDLKLPRMGGLELLEKLGKEGIHIPAIVMTFHGTEDTAVRALRLGARDYLIKPFTLEDMQAALERALRAATTATPVREQSTEANCEQLAEELARTRAALADREEQLKRLSTASQMAAKVPSLEQELARIRATLAQQQNNPDQAAATGLNDEKVAELEQELAQTRALLATREGQLRQVQHYLSNFVKKTDYTELAQQAAALKEENSRLQEILNQSEQRSDALEQMIGSQKVQLNKYQQQARTMAEELRNLSEAVRLLSQDLSQQTKQLEAVGAVPKKIKSPSENS